MKLQFKATPEDFIVREALRQEPGTAGDFSVYRVTKRLLTTMEVQERIAAEFGTAPRTLSFPALKDKGAQATQYFSVRGRAPSHITGQGYVAQFIGRIPRPLGPQDLAGNWFTIALRGLSAIDVAALLRRIPTLEKDGLPNYFDEQRFGSYAGENDTEAHGGFIGKAILLGDAEGALRLYLAQPMPGDSSELRAFKYVAAAHWGHWAGLLAEAPRSNQRSILSFLNDHPKDFRKAVNLITPRLLPLLLEAYQSFLWNRIASRYLASEPREEGGRAPPTITIAGEDLTVYRELPAGEAMRLRGMNVTLPQNKAEYGDPSLAEIVAGVLAEEGLQLERVKARILTKAYLPKGSRPLLVVPEGAKGEVLEEKGVPSNSTAVVLTFFLPPGAYATLVVKVLAVTA